MTVLQHLGSFVLLYDIGLTDTLLTKNKVNKCKIRCVQFLPKSRNATQPSNLAYSKVEIVMINCCLFCHCKYSTFKMHFSSSETDLIPQHMDDYDGFLLLNSSSR